MNRPGTPSRASPPASPHTAPESDELGALALLATAMGVRTEYVDGLGRHVAVGPETLLRVCTALGAEIDRPARAPAALGEYRHARSRRRLPEVVIAWDGVLELSGGGSGPLEGELVLEDGTRVDVRDPGSGLVARDRLPYGYHRLTVHADSRSESCAVISAPVHAWRRDPEDGRSWGVGSHLAALRSKRSRSLGDLRDLELLCRWVGSQGGDLVTVLPLLPTFNAAPPEPSPYSPVSRLFWSELVLDLGDAHRPVDPPASLDVTRADAEVREALRELPPPDPASIDAELARYARFRGAQARYGRDWRQWPARARNGRLLPWDIDPEEERFHLVAQVALRHQLSHLQRHLDADGLRLGLDLAVGVHPDGYDPWSRQALFASGVSVGAPPDLGFPSGQDWGFSPVLPGASRREGHAYLAASIAHQAALAGVLRVDHIMALTRLYWIPHGFGLHQGTYVTYPAEELFAILTLESHRNRCEVVGENLGTVPAEIHEALPRHRIWGMFLAQFEAMAEKPRPPGEDEVALIGTHDTPTLVGWMDGVDIDERVRTGLLDAEAAPAARVARKEGVERLAELLDASPDDPEEVLAGVLDWLGRSPSPLVIPWVEDLWLESEQVNLPGTRSSERPNWQRPMDRLLDDALADPDVVARARGLHEARQAVDEDAALPST